MIVQKPRPRAQQTAQTVNVAAPVAGWNARDAYAQMGKNDAVVLKNWWPGTNSVKLRKGYTNHATGISGKVQTLMAYNGGGTSKLFAFAQSWAWDVTSGGAVGATLSLTSTNPRWQHVNFTTSGGTSYLLAVNGTDKLLSYNGSSWHSDGDGAHDISGLDTATATNITVFKNRVWLLQANTLKAWYLQINAVAGAATSLDMSSICQMGGYLMAVGTWTLDGGLGIDDHLVFITSKGEVLVWKLTDPTTPSGIALVGLWRIGSPIGRRCMLKYNGDILIITTEGVVPLSKALQSSSGSSKVSVTDKIQLAMNNAVINYGSNFGWQLLNYPKANQLYLNVPIAEGSQRQYVQNNITQSWCEFDGWAAYCWELFNDEPYFGGDGFIGRAWHGDDDNGSDINAFALQSFQAYGGAREKQCTMIRFHILSSGPAALYGNVNTDYDLSDHSAELAAAPFSAGLWDVALWDVDVWGSGLTPSAQWQSATGTGYAFAPVFKTSTQGTELEWAATDMVFSPGGTL